MADATIIDGKAIAADVRKDVADRVARLKREHGVTPGLAVVLVGEDPASQVYVRNKGRQTIECGMQSFEHKLPAETSEDDLLALVGDLNRADEVHGILVQMPLPKHMNADRVIEAIDPEKDVDGFHAVNVGRLSIGQQGFVPCTPAGSMILLGSLGVDLSGKHAVVIGRSNIVGKPMAHLLLQANCTVTIAHSRTQDLPETVRQGDIVIAAVGRPEMVRGDWIKPGALVIDVGINRVDSGRGDSKTKLVGDVAFDEVSAVAGAITPVPGGVGPMTIACLLKNTIEAAERSASL
ncbi:MAG: bifunctional methylenetetrahydrofolate dehydrogenase/methenyltetrahydrofolate cyclohydrolase FolD [Pseudomonadota bacterium]